VEKLSDGVRRITEGYGADIVIDAMGGEILSEALGTLSIGGSLTTLGYAAGRKATIDVTDLIWKRASMKSFSLFSQPAEVWTTAWNLIFQLLQSGAVKPIVAKTFPLAQAADALRYLVEGRPLRQGRPHNLTAFCESGMDTNEEVQDRCSGRLPKCGA